MTLNVPAADEPPHVAVTVTPFASLTCWPPDGAPLGAALTVDSARGGGVGLPAVVEAAALQAAIDDVSRSKLASRILMR